MKKSYAHFFGAILLGAVVVAGSPDSARAELDPNVIARVRTILQDPEGDGFSGDLTALVRVVPEFASQIASVAARMRPDMALEIFDAVAAASPNNAVTIAAAIASAVPYMRVAIKVRLSEFMIANADPDETESEKTETGQLASGYVPEIQSFTLDTLEDSIVISPTI